MANYLEIDGSILEGGGQILRMAISLSAITGTPIRVSKIRLGRKKPGLAAQHLTGLELVASMCNGKLTGGSIGSVHIEFVPSKIKGGNYRADTKTAGSIALLLQVAVPCALFADGDVNLELFGGTNADMAPQVDTITEVFRPIMEKFGATFDFDLHKRGYFPKGGGHVSAHIKAIRALRPLVMTDRGSLAKISGWSFTAGNLPPKLSDIMAEGAKHAIKSSLGNVNVDIMCYKESREMAPNNCNGIILVGETSTGCILGGSGLGSRDREARQVGASAAEEIISAYNSGACLDEHSQDQIIILMALAAGTSSVLVGDVSLHTKTAMYVAELLTKVKFTCTPHGSTGNLITCTGLGYTNSSLA